MERPTSVDQHESLDGDEDNDEQQQAHIDMVTPKQRRESEGEIVEPKQSEQS